MSYSAQEFPHQAPFFLLELGLQSQVFLVSRGQRLTVQVVVGFWEASAFLLDLLDSNP